MSRIFFNNAFVAIVMTISDLNRIQLKQNLAVFHSEPHFMYIIIIINHSKLSYTTQDFFIDY